MSRAGYSDDLDQWDLIRWRGQVTSAIRGKRGQRLLADLKKALEAMPERRLIADVIEDAEGDVCALGAVARARGISVQIDTEDHQGLAKTFDIAQQLAREVMFVNDEMYYSASPEARWQRVYEWTCANIRPSKDEE